MPSPWTESDLDASRAEMPRPEYPHPDFRRATAEGIDWINLNGDWAFEFDPRDSGESDAWYTGDRTLGGSIQVPFGWESHLAWHEGHLATNDNYFSTRAFITPTAVDTTNYREQPRHEIGWYQRSVRIPESWTGQRTILHMCASDWQTRVWVNGTLLGTHEGGYTPFEFDISSACAPGDNALITIRVFDPDNHRAIPGGKQIDWYARTSGIWQTVYLEPRPEVHLSGIQITPDIDSATAHVRVTVQDPAPGDVVRELSLEILAPDGRRISQAAPITDGSQPVALPDPMLWSPESPYMYEASVELVEDGRVVDRVQTSFGMRKISIDRLPGTETNYVHLNDTPIYLLGALDQSYNPWGLYTFPTEEAMKDDLRRTREFGFNFLRLHIKIEEPLFLHWADRLGVLLMCDIPNFASDAYGPEAQSRWETTMRASVERDYNHPSVFSWVCFNETWGLGGEEFKVLPERQEWVRSMYHLTRSLDPSRLVEDNSPCLFDHVESQINSWHFYINDYWDAREHIKEVVDKTEIGSSFNYTGGNTQNDAPLMNSEYGGISAGMGDRDVSWCFKYLTNELRLHEKICGYIYTELQDIEWEHNGFMNYDRTIKAFGYDYRMINNLDALVIDAPPGATVPGGAEVEFDVYSSRFSGLDSKAVKLCWRVSALDRWGNVESEIYSGSESVSSSPYRVEKVAGLKIPMPTGNRLCTIDVWIENVARRIISRNFITREIFDGPMATIDLHADYLALRYDVQSARDRAWSGGILDDGDIAIGIGAGHVDYPIGLPDGIDLERVTAMEIWGEFSSGREATPQTDAARHSSNLEIQINRQLVSRTVLANAPADSRGALSYINGVAGRYGYLVKVDVAGPRLKEILSGINDDSLSLRFEIPEDSQRANGLAVYGARAGRYPLQPCVVFRFG